MRRMTLNALTWGTVTGAVMSALWLAATEANWLNLSSVLDWLRPAR